ncbi:signal recognition particle, SRP9/SRP14 subunit, partial [Collybia nuda]
FLTQLTTLFESTKGQGTIWLTHKRFTYDEEDVNLTHADPSGDNGEYPCLLRASDGGKNKFSTKVEVGQLQKFYAAYGSLLKTSMTTLRKRDKKREKVHSEQAAQRKKKMTDPVIITGAKRGNGRKKRQRKIKAALKQQESQQKAKEREEARLKSEHPQ